MVGVMLAQMTPTTAAPKLSEVTHEPLTKAAGLYVGRPVYNKWQLEEWCAKQGYTLDPYPHVTVLYSDVVIPWVDMQDNLYVSVSGWKILGPDNAVVLTLGPSELDVRWQNAIKAGAKSTYDSYCPHVTLFYLGAGADTSTFIVPEVPTFSVDLGPEVHADLSTSTENVFKGMPTSAQERLALAVQARKSKPVSPLDKLASTLNR